MVVVTLYHNVKVRGQLWAIDSLSLSLGFQELNSACQVGDKFLYLLTTMLTPHLIYLRLSLPPSLELTALAVPAGQ